MNTEIIARVKELRLRISEAIAMISKLDKSRETALAYTQAQEGFMFLGSLLNYFGAEDRYPQEKDKASAKIMDSVDADDVELPEGKNALEIVKAVRAVLQGCIADSLWNVLMDATTDPGRAFVSHQNRGWAAVNHSLLCVMSAKMWLGMELNRIVNEEGLKVSGKKESDKALDGMAQANPPSQKEQLEAVAEKGVADGRPDDIGADKNVDDKESGQESLKESSVEENVAKLSVKVMKEKLTGAGVKFNNNIGQKKLMTLYIDTFYGKGEGEV